MIHMNGREVMKFPPIRTIDLEGFEKLWDERKRNIFFLLRETKLVKTLPQGWAMRYVEDEGFIDEILAGDDDVWDFGMGEEWCQNDNRDPKVKAKGPTHQNCGVDCPVVVDYIAYMKRIESDEEED